MAAGLAMLCGEALSEQCTLGFPGSPPHSKLWVCFGPGERLDNTALKAQVPAFTDNKGNGHVINKLISTSRHACSPHGSRMDTERTQPRGQRLVQPPDQQLSPSQRIENQPERAKLAGPSGAPRSKTAVPQTEGAGSRTAEGRGTAREKEEEEGGQAEVPRKVVEARFKRS